MSSGGGKSQVVGYKYFVGLHMILCHGPVDYLLRIMVGDKQAWAGRAASGRIDIDKPQLFGGESREGGVSGAVDFAPGGPSQGVNDYLAGMLGGVIPAFRGVAALVWRKTYWGMYPYLKAVVARAQRVYTRQNGLRQWYPETAGILSASVDQPFLLKVRVTWRNYPPELPEPTWLFYQDGFVGGTIGSTFSLPETVNHARMVLGQYVEAVWVTNAPPAGQLTFQIQFPAFSMTTACEGQISVKRAGETEWTVLLENGNSDLTPYGSYTDGWFRCVGLFPQYWRVNLRYTDFQSDVLDLNPAHIIRECLTDPEWGMGYQETDVDDDAFSAAADRLFAERMGMSILWDKQIPIEDFVREVVRHIDGVLYPDRTTGRFVLRLLRADYDENALLLLGPGSIERVEGYARPAFGELVNVVTVTYWDTLTGKESSLSVDDPAQVQLQGGVVGTAVQYPGFTNASVAARAAQRDLRALSTPLLSCTIYATRTAAVLNIGDPFRFSWPDYHDGHVVMRVTSMALGDGRSNKVKIVAVQDVFDLPEVARVVAPDPGWIDPGSVPGPASARIVTEAPYYEIVQRIGERETAALLADAPEVGYLVTSAARPAGAINATMMVDAGAGYVDQGITQFSPTAALAAGVGPADIVLPITVGVDLEDVVPGTHAQIGAELVRVDAVTATQITVGRGVLDTVPATHQAGVIIFFWDDFAVADQTEYVDGETVSVKLLPANGGGALDQVEAPSDTLTFAQRAIRPYPPGQFAINGDHYPDTTAGAMSVTWASRSRVQQTGGAILDFTSGNVTPEPGTTYRIEIESLSGETLHTQNAISALSATVSATVMESLPNRIRVKLFAVRDSIDSYQPQAWELENLGGVLVMETLFGGYAVGAWPAGWSKLWAATTVGSGVAARAGAPSGRVLTVQPSVTGRVAARWDGAWQSPDADLLVVAEVAGSVVSNNNVFGGMCRVSGAAGTENALRVFLRGGDAYAQSVAVGQVVAGAGADAVAVYGMVDGSIVGFWAARLRVSGSTLMGKAWRLASLSADPLATEPPFWHHWCQITLSEGNDVALGVGASGAISHFARVRVTEPSTSELAAIEMIGSSQTAFTAASSTAAVVVSVPPAVVEGDLLVLSLMRRQTVTMPSGWTLAASQQCADAGTTQWTDVYTKVAGAAESGGTLVAPVTLSITLSAAGRTNAILTAWRATDASPLAVESSVGTTTAAGPSGVALPSLVSAADDGVALTAVSLVAMAASGSPYLEITGPGCMQVGRRTGPPTNQVRHALSVRRVDVSDDSAAGAAIATNNTVSQEHAIISLIINKAP